MIVTDCSNQSLDFRTITVPDFEISYAGASPWPGYCLGSDDGRVGLLSLDHVHQAGPYDVSPTGEAINGIAFIKGVMAVSTRNDITFLKESNLGTEHDRRASFCRGAHGVVGTQGGGFLAPMGKQGILWVSPERDEVHQGRILKPADDIPYVYKVIGLHSPDRGEVLALAGRRGGFAAMPLPVADMMSHGRRIRPSGVDFIDVATLNLPGFPLAVAALGLDCSIRFVRDLLVDRTTTTLQFAPNNERAYRILCAEGHVFLLTDKSLYAFVDLAMRFIRGEVFTNPTVTRKLDLEAVDATLGPDRSLLVVMTDHVCIIEIDSIIAREDAQTKNPLNTSQVELVPLESFDSPWGQPETIGLTSVT